MRKVKDLKYEREFVTVRLIRLVREGDAGEKVKIVDVDPNGKRHLVYKESYYQQTEIESLCGLVGLQTEKADRQKFSIDDLDHAALCEDCKLKYLQFAKAVVSRHTGARINESGRLEF